MGCGLPGASYLQHVARARRRRSPRQLQRVGVFVALACSVLLLLEERLVAALRGELDASEGAARSVAPASCYLPAASPAKEHGAVGE
jgi:hypothetical protein